MTPEEVILEALYNTRAEMFGRMYSQRKNASGKTARSFQVVSLGGLHAGMEGFRYAGVNERGRTPGKVPVGMINILNDWARAKGLSFPDDKSFNRFLWSVMRSIRMRGTNKMYYRDIFSTPWDNLMRELPSNLGDAYITKFINTIWQQQ